MAGPFDLQPEPALNGIGDFVGALMGGGQARQNAYRDELGSVSSLDKKLAEAAMARDQARALSQLDAGAASRLLGLGPEQADMAGDWSNVLRSGGGTGGASNIAQALIRAHELGTRQNAQALAMEPDSGFTPINAQLIGLADKPLPTVDVDGNNVIRDPYSAAPGIETTPIGGAMVEAANALAEQRRASAGASSARADLIGRTDPNRPRSGKKDSKSSTTVGPKPGDVMDGYRFKGGNPSDKANWERL